MAGPGPTLTPAGATGVIDAGWRAAAYCLHPRVIGWSLLPLLLAVLITLGLSWFFWEPAVAAVRANMENWMLVDALRQRFHVQLHSVLAPLILTALALPLVMGLSIVLVAALMTPALTKLVAERRFPALEKRHGGSLLGGLLGALGATALALLLLLASTPLWLIPPLVLVLPPLIWGWLSYRVFSYDVLAEHASAEERRALLRRRRWALWSIGIVAGYLGAAPSLIFAFGALNLVFAPLLMPIAIWLYMLVFAFAALWFAHYLLAELDALRGPRQELLP
jgi:hypothetical protein